jgi:hypothetical protein
MGFNSYHIPDPEEFIRRLESGTGPREFVAIRKIDAVMGNSDSIKMLDKMYEMVKADHTNEEVIKELKSMLK